MTTGINSNCYSMEDTVSINGWEYTAEMDICPKMGTKEAIQGGRIVYICIKQYGEPVCIYDRGDWILPPDENKDDAILVVLGYFLAKNNKRLTKAEERRRLVHEYVSGRDEETICGCIQ